jgi:histidinol-phosphatase (PHP family)
LVLHLKNRSWSAVDAFSVQHHRIPLRSSDVAIPGLDQACPLLAVLSGVIDLVTGSDAFAVLAHIDYAIRSWPADSAGPFDPAVFEEEFRGALRATAQSGRALEINTRLPMHPTIVTWWHQEGGDAVTFGSDAHQPAAVGHGFKEAAQMAEAHGFRPGRHPHDFWPRVR